MSDEYSAMLRELMTAVDIHRLMTQDRNEHDAALYAAVSELRRRLA